jgi:tRNA pseudouridine55 synthase
MDDSSPAGRKQGQGKGTDGVLVVDKPTGLTSFDVVARVRRACREKRVGHAGTLDPEATGVLVVCLGEATKLVPYLMDADKEYRATARLGITTDTDDAAPGSQVLCTAPEAALAALTESQIAEALARLVGSISQKPPRFSALKVDGQRLYDKARAVRTEEESLALESEVAAKTRTVEIFGIELESVSLAAPFPELTFRVHCGKGTYIRSIARDLGEALGVGGHLTALRRLRVGRFEVSQGVSIDQLGSAQLLPLPTAVAHLPSLCVSPEIALRVRQGHRATVAALPLPQAAVAAIFDEQQNLIALLSRSEGTWRIARGF